MSGQPDDDSEKSFDATPQRLQKAREKGEVARSADLGAAATYGGLLLALLVSGGAMIERAGTAMTVLIDQADALGALMIGGSGTPVAGGLMWVVALALAPLFLIPVAVVCLTVVAQQAFLVTPSRIAPKLSRISLISNAKNKFGRSGLFEFFKSFAKLLIYSVCVALFLKAHMGTLTASVQTAPQIVAVYIARLCLQFLAIIFLVALAIGALDWVWQRQEHLRKNRMSRKEVMDETKEAEGDPYLKSERRQRGQRIAMNRMLDDVAGADVVIVNPTHFAVALKWSRLPGEAPVCVAKGVDAVAATIRTRAAENDVPIHSDPPTARALHATVDIGAQIPEAQYRAVAVAIRFAEDMRRKARFTT
jgi:flagellar biosynthetic protein FlhB